MQLKTLTEKLEILDKYVGREVHFVAGVSSTKCNLTRNSRFGHVEKAGDFDSYKLLVEHISELVELTDKAHNPTGEWWFE